MRVLACKLLPCLLLSLTCFISMHAYAATTLNETINHNTWFIGIGGGTTAIDLPNTTTIANGAPAPYNQDRYSIKNPVANVLQLFLGYRWHQEQLFLPYYSAAFRYSHYLGTDIKGQITQYSLPEFLNYNYQVNYEADSFMLMGKVDVLQYKQIMPYVTGGVGVMINHLNHYSETALPFVTPRTSPGYRGNTAISGAIALGAGIDFIATDDLWLTVGYEHIFQGALKTDAGVGSWSNTALDIGDINMDTIFISLTANFPDALRR